MAKIFYMTQTIRNFKDLYVVFDGNFCDTTKEKCSFKGTGDPIYCCKFDEFLKYNDNRLIRANDCITKFGVE